jgi:hypothetical protein
MKGIRQAHVKEEEKKKRNVCNTKAFLKITLPSTEDIPLLTGKHDWGPWHTAVWMLIDCSNLLGHIHESMLPGALYDLDLEPSFPPVITRESSQRKKIFTQTGGTMTKSLCTSSHLVFPQLLLEPYPSQIHS